MTKVLKALMQCCLQKSRKKKLRRLSKGPRRRQSAICCDNGNRNCLHYHLQELQQLSAISAPITDFSTRRGGSRASHKRQSPFTNFYFIPTDDWRNWTDRFKSQPQLIFIIPHFACTNNRVQTGSARSNIKTMQSWSSESVHTDRVTVQCRSLQTAQLLPPLFHFISYSWAGSEKLCLKIFQQLAFIFRLSDHLSFQS